MTEIERLHAKACEYFELRMDIEEAKNLCQFHEEKGPANVLIPLSAREEFEQLQAKMSNAASNKQAAPDSQREGSAAFDLDRLEEFDEELSAREDQIQDAIMFLDPESVTDALIHLSLVQAMAGSSAGDRYTQFQRDTLAPRMLAGAIAVLARETGSQYDPEKAPFGVKGRTWEMDHGEISEIVRAIKLKFPEEKKSAA